MGKHTKVKIAHSAAGGRHRREVTEVQRIEYRRADSNPLAPKHPAGYVGRVGALAVALGVGSAVVAMPMAFADQDGSPGSTGSSSTAASPSSPGQAAKSPRSSRPAPRTGTSPSTSSNGPAQQPGAESSGEAPSKVPSESTRARGARGAGSSGAAADTESERDNRSDRPGATQATEAAEAAAPTGVATSARNDEQTSEPTQPSVAPGAGTPDDNAPDSNSTPVSDPVVVSSESAKAAAAAPVMTAARSRAAVSGMSESLLSWLAIGGNTGGPAAAPLAWTAVAFTRRELNGSNRAAPPGGGHHQR